MRCSDIGVMCVCIALELCSRVLHGCIIVSEDITSGQVCRRSEEIYPWGSFELSCHD